MAVVKEPTVDGGAQGSVGCAEHRDGFNGMVGGSSLLLNQVVLGLGLKA